MIVGRKKCINGHSIVNTLADARGSFTSISPMVDKSMPLKLLKLTLIEEQRWHIIIQPQRKAQTYMYMYMYTAL